MNFNTVICVTSILFLSACGGGGGGSDTGGGSTGGGTVSFNLAGTWTDTDTVGSNSCGLALPAPGTSRVTNGIVIEQTGNQISLTGPVNVLGTRTIASGTIGSDGSMVLTGTDSGTTIRLNFRATSDTMITGNSTVVASGCTYNFTNSLVKT